MSAFDIIAILILCFMYPTVEAVKCYQCLLSDHGNCRDSVCDGLFGCFKTITYTGGADQSGVQSEDSQYQWKTTKGCEYWPFGGTEGCNEQPLLGAIRQVTCNCNDDYCNSAFGVRPSHFSIFLLLIACLYYTFNYFLVK